MRHTLLFVAAVVLLGGGASLIGCGGGSAEPPAPTPSPAPALTRVRLQVQWSARSRAEALLTSPSSARSVRIVVGNGLELKADRAARTESYTEILESSAPLPPGAQAFSAAFYSDSNQSGPVLGQASGTLSLEPGGALTGSVTVANMVSVVSIEPNQHVKLGIPTEIVFRAHDSNGALVALSPGSAFLSFADSASSSRALITSDHRLQGAAAGVVLLRLSVDGVLSSAQSVVVDAPLQVTITPKLPTLTLSEKLAFSVLVTGTGNTTATWSVSVEEPQGGTITEAGLYTAPGVAGTYHVVVTSQVDPTKSDRATVTVGSGSGTVIVQ
ncbi:hypothetical protein [Armatimonas sp.]|uniref:hypothetical protein n=1 Tax=Armatimonas sp. TaxID=1872638 RepID=UPI0037511DE5